MNIESLRDLYQDPYTPSSGYSFEYRNYVLKKSEGTEHSVFEIYNERGRKVENFTVDAFKSYEKFQKKLDELIDYNPDSMDDWLNR